MIVCVLWVCTWVHMSEETRGISFPLDLKPEPHAIVSHDTQKLKTELAFARVLSHLSRILQPSTKDFPRPPPRPVSHRDNLTV